MADSPETRRSLILRLGEAGNDADWLRFQDFYWRYITGCARRLGCAPAAAEDIFQQTALCLVNDLAGFEHSGRPGAFRNYLRTIVKHKVIDFFRREGRHWQGPREDGHVRALDGPGAWTDQIDPNADARDVAMDRVWLHTVVDRALEAARHRCSPEKWESFRRYVLYGEDATALAADLGITKGCLFQHKSSFLDMLREEVVKLLDDLDDLPGELRQTDAARKFLRRALEDYLAARADLRDTAVISAPPEATFDRVRVLREACAAAPPPGPGDWLLVLPDRTWAPLAATTIGTAPDCGLRLAADGVSAHHARLEADGNGWRIIDEGSTNGVWRHGQRLGEAPIGAGDWLELGHAVVVVVRVGDCQRP